MCHMDHCVGFTRASTLQVEAHENDGVASGVQHEHELLGVDDDVLKSDSDGCDEHTKDADATHTRFHKSDDVVKLMRHYLAETLTPHAYMSIHVLSEDGLTRVERVFQILDLERHSILVKTWADARKKETLYTCSVQPLERWNPRGEIGIVSHMDVFVAEDPLEVGVLELCGCGPTVRSELRACRVGRRGMRRLEQPRRGAAVACFGLSEHPDSLPHGRAEVAGFGSLPRSASTTLRLARASSTATTLRPADATSSAS
jgi:hypothetical protein